MDEEAPRYSPAVAEFPCKCSVCEQQAHRSTQTIVTHKYLFGDCLPRTFTWLLKQLSTAAQTRTVKLCLLETAVFANNRPVLMLTTARDGRLRNHSANLGEVVKTVLSAVRFRKREANLQQYSDIKVFPREAAVARFFKEESEEGPMRVLTDNEFTELLWERASGKFWKKLVYLQALLNPRRGEPVNYEFTAKPKRRIAEILAAGWDLEKFLRKHPTEDPMERTCLQIYFHVGQTANAEIRRMQVEFATDCSGTLWVVYANKILVKPFTFKPRVRSTQAEPVLQPAGVWSFLKSSLLLPRTAASKRILKTLDDMFEEVTQAPEKTPPTALSTSQIRRIPKPVLFAAGPPKLATARTVARIRSWKYNPRLKLRSPSRTLLTRR